MQNGSFYVQRARRTRAKRAKLLFFVVKYANLCRSCCHRHRSCLSSLVILEQGDQSQKQLHCDSGHVWKGRQFDTFAIVWHVSKGLHSLDLASHAKSSPFTGSKIASYRQLKFCSSGRCCKAHDICYDNLSSVCPHTIMTYIMPYSTRSCTSCGKEIPIQSKTNPKEFFLSRRFQQTESLHGKPPKY